MQATQMCYVPYPSKKKDKIDWLAVLKVVELPDEEVGPTPELNVPFQVDEVEVHEIDMNVSVDEEILLHDLNGGVLEWKNPLMGYIQSIMKSLENLQRRSMNLKKLRRMRKNLKKI
ncbi:hypothetical protein MTR67_021732 [Solanum verrucosum]|uniref:Uncharacterized protein n=1 Tax=Solanum verrucosum TaxID=315347 RepID=A0AAF0QQJ7_SOLVR|nr:hypothetical protein MTR67_021732 [Solanum verrucosum]